MAGRFLRQRIPQECCSAGTLRAVSRDTLPRWMTAQSSSRATVAAKADIRCLPWVAWPTWMTGERALLARPFSRECRWRHAANGPGKETNAYPGEGVHEQFQRIR